MTNGISGNRFLFRPVGAGIFGDSISQGVALGWDIERLRRYLLTGNLGLHWQLFSVRRLLIVVTAIPLDCARLCWAA